MPARRTVSGRLTPDQPEWRVKLGRVIADYHERLLEDGGWTVTVNLTQEVPSGTGVDHRQGLWSDLKHLNTIVETALVHEPAFEYRPGPLAGMKPAMQEEVGPFEVAYFARQRPDGGRHVAVVVEQKGGPSDDGPRQRFVCNLDRLTELVGEGKEFQRILSEAQRKYPVIYAEPTSLRESDGRWARARVAEWAPSLREGEAIVQRNANTPGVPRLAVYPVALRVATNSPNDVEVRHGLDGQNGAISRAISDACFDRYRAGPDYVVAEWADLHRPPEVGLNCTYDGMKTAYNGEMRDYGASVRPKPGNEGVPQEKLYVLLKKDHESRLPYAATVEMVSADRGVVQGEFCRRERLDPPGGPGSPVQPDLTRSSLPEGYRHPRRP